MTRSRAAPASAHRRKVPGEQFERPARQRGHGAEVPLVERQDAPGLEAVGENDDREVGEARSEVSVSVREGRERQKFRVRDGFKAVAANCKVVQECPRGAASKAGLEKVVNFGRDERGDRQWFGRSAQSALRVGAAGVSCVRGGNNGPSVDEDGHSPKPRINSSSGMSATEQPSPLPESKCAKWGGPDRARS